MSSFDCALEQQDVNEENDDLSETVNETSCEPKEVKEVKDCIKEDHAFIKEFVPEAAIIALSEDYVTVVIMRTPYARVQLRVMYLPTYPDEVPVVELTSPTLPFPLLRSKEKECQEQGESSLGRLRFIVYLHICTHSFTKICLFLVGETRAK